MADRSPPADVLLVTDVFPPAVGGTAELFANVYSRLAPLRVSVITGGLGSGVRTVANVGTIRMTDRGRAWGVIRPRACLHHAQRAARIFRLAARDRPVVHCGRLVPEGVDAWWSLLAGGPRFVCWAHGEELNYARLSRELGFLMKRVCRSASALIANSRNTAGMLVSFGARPDQVEVVYPGVDPGRFSVEQRTAAKFRATLAATGELVWLTVGRLQKRKGHDLVLRALGAWPLGAPRVRYVVVGDGDERSRLQALALELGVADRVTFAGLVPADQLPVYYAAADVFVHPNRVDGADFEGFGIVFLEAAAAGLPVVAGSTGGAPEAVVNGVTGLLVSGTDVHELASALLGLSKDASRRQALGRSGRERVTREFSWQRAAERVASIHHRVNTGRS